MRSVERLAIGAVRVEIETATGTQRSWGTTYMPDEDALRPYRFYVMSDAGTSTTTRSTSAW